MIDKIKKRDIIKSKKFIFLMYLEKIYFKFIFIRIEIIIFFEFLIKICKKLCYNVKIWIYI